MSVNVELEDEVHTRVGWQQTAAHLPVTDVSHSLPQIVRPVTAIYVF